MHVGKEVILPRRRPHFYRAGLQHEIDHLDGKVFVDYLSRLKQMRIRKKLEKQQKLAM